MLKRLMTSDSAENSIMQTITIAVSAILIASGLVTAPGLINNARDNNAKTNLSNIAYAQEYEMADKGAYAPSLPARVGIALSRPGEKSCYVAFSESASGRMFFRSCDSNETREIPQEWSATAPVGFPASVTWPTLKSDVLGNISPDFSTWVVKNGATYNPDSGSITLTNSSSTAYSTLIPVNNIKSFKIAFDAMLPQRLAEANKNTVVVGVSYWQADGVTPAYNAGGTGPNQGPWVANGHAVQIPGANTWQHVASTLGTGLTAPTPEIKYIRIDFSISTTYSQAGVQIQNPSLTVGR
jgi:hypothetical protein